MTKSLLETDIFNYKTPEFFINMKNIPDKTSVDRKAFVLEEKRKGREGINVNGIYIPGNLYFHLNYYHLEGDDPVSKKKKVMLPRLRDNEWVIFNDYHYCSVEKLIYLLFGARQIAKSEIETSLCLRELSLFTQTEALALFSGKPDKDTFVKKISTAITHGEKFMIIPNIDKDWSKEEIRFGITRVDNTTDLRGRLYIYNTQEGKKIQVGSGKSVSFLLMDEIAKSPFRGVYDTIEPALLSDFGGLRCAPILAFTGGETDKAQDAKNIIENPNKENQFMTTLDDGQEIGGRFMSGLYRKDCKEEKTISDYLSIKTDTWLDDYPIHVSNFEKARVKIEKEKEEALKSPEKTTFTLKRIFFPLTLDDVFLTESNNKFPKEIIESHIKWLQNHYTPTCVSLYRNSKGVVEWKFSEDKPISIFPVKPEHNKEAPVVIFEHPIPDAPNFTYTIGIDPINNDESNDKIVSLGSINVYKRMLSPLDEFKNEIVCTWAGRYKETKDFHELALMIAEYYKAVGSVLPEASENTLIQHFNFKRKGHYLADSFDIQRDINKFTKASAKKGLPPSVPNQRHYMNLMIEEANEEIFYVNEEGLEEMTYGVTKIRDIMLLTEMLQYKGKSEGRGVHDGNFDRIISYGCALTLAKHFDTKYPILNTQIKKQEVDNQLFKQIKTTIKTPFGTFGGGKTNSNMFGTEKGKSNLPRWMR